LKKEIYICLDIGNYFTNIDPWWKFINNDTGSSTYLTYFNHSLSRTIIGSGQNRNPGLYFIYGYGVVFIIIIIGLLLYQPDENIITYAFLNDIYINANTETGFNQDKLYCGCSHFPCLSIPYGYGRLNDDVIYIFMCLFK
jgi:hypothetical protein